MRRMRPHLRKIFSLFKFFSRTEGSEIIEFAVSLPILIVAAVGIYDFGTAFIVKQKLTNAVLDGARVAANQPTNDLSSGASGNCGAPTSICAIRDVVRSDLAAGNVNDCGLGTVASDPANRIWRFTANCSGTITLEIERAYTYTSAMPAPFPANYQVEATRVTLIYPYRWSFNRVLPILVRGATYAPATDITSVAVMHNIN